MMENEFQSSKHQYSLWKKEEGEKISAEEKLSWFIKKDYEFAYNLLKAENLEKQWEVLKGKKIAISFEVFKELMSLPVMQEILKERAVLHDIKQEQFSDIEVFKQFLLWTHKEQMAFLEEKGYFVKEDVLKDFCESMYWMFESSVLLEYEKISEKLFFDNDWRKKIIKTDGSLDLTLFVEQCKNSNIPIDEKSFFEDTQNFDEKMLPVMNLLKRMQTEENLQREFEEKSKDGQSLLLFLKKETKKEYQEEDLNLVYEVLQQVVMKQTEILMQKFLKKLSQNETFFKEIIENIDDEKECMLIAKKYEIDLMTEMIDILRFEITEYTKNKMEYIMEQIFQNLALREELSTVAGDLIQQRRILGEYGINISEKFCTILFEKISEGIMDVSIEVIEKILKDQSIMNVLCDEEVSYEEKYQIISNEGYDLPKGAFNSLLRKIEIYQKRKNAQEQMLEQLKYLLLNNEQLKEELYNFKGDLEGQWRVIQEHGIAIEFEEYKKFILGGVENAAVVVGEFIQALDDDVELSRRFFANLGDFDAMWALVCEYGFDRVEQDLFWEILENFLKMDEATTR